MQIDLNISCGHGNELIIEQVIIAKIASVDTNIEIEVKQ